MANQFLALSLFLMLLSFFIVLNSVSEFETSKSQPIMNSLSLAFTNRPSTVPVAPSNVPADEPIKDGKRKGDTLRELEGLFSAHISGFTAKRNRFGTVMHVRLPIGRFENALAFNSYNESEITPNGEGAFLPTLITILRASEKNIQYRLDIILNDEANPAVQDHVENENYMRNLRRITNIANMLEDKGLPKKMMSIGLKQGEEGMMDMYFYRYKPFTLALEDARDE